MTDRNSAHIARDTKFLPVAVSVIFSLVIAVAAIANAKFLVQVNAIRYISYGLPAGLAICWILFPKTRDYSQNNLFWVVTMLLSMLIPLLLSGSEGLKYVIFMWLGFVAFAMPLRFDHRTPVVFLLVLIAAQLIVFSTTGLSVRRLSVDSLTSGSAAVTHTLPGLFGILLGALLAQRRYKAAALCALFIFLSGKRGVLLASAIATAFMFASQLPAVMKLRKSETRSPTLFFAIAATGMTITLLLPHIFDFLAMSLGVNVNVLTSGRYSGQRLAYNSITDGTISDLIWGQGLGAADAYAFIGFHGLANIIHNDYLRLIVDFGIVNGIIFAICYLTLVGKGRVGAYMAAFSAYLWFTENNLINLMMTCMVYICVHSSQTSNKPLGDNATDNYQAPKRGARLAGASV